MILRSRKGRAFEEITPALMENGQSSHPEEDVVLERENERLERCLKGLAGPQQQCVTLFYLEDKCYKEITAITGFDHNQVKSFIQNGKRNLRLCMEQNA
jgi:RNA polymerase sigma-70 factor (ECF subfamily)